ncbi:MAG: DUF1987 domain-containing protein [Crocinitomicaceae bacterium]
MEKLELKGSPKTPDILLDGDNGQIRLKGRSIPENSIEFFDPIYSWIDTYCESPCSETVLDVRLEYFNTSSSKCLLDIFKKFEKINGNRSHVRVNWYFERDDEDMAEAGEDYQAIVDLPFDIIEVDEI